MGPFDVLEYNPLDAIQAARYRWQAYGEFNQNALPLSEKATVLALIAPTKIVIDEITKVNELIDGNANEKAVLVVKRNKTFKSFYDSLVELEPVAKKAFKFEMEVFEKEFFPGNLTEYRRANIREQSPLILRIKNAVTKYSDKFDPATVALFDAYNADYIEALKVQIKASQNFALKRAEYKNILKRFKRQMWINMLTIACAYVDEPGIAPKYFNPMVLHPYHKNSKGEPIAKALKITLKALSILLTDFTYTAAEKVIIENTGKISIFYFSTDVELTVMLIPEDAVEVEAGGEAMVSGGILKKFFYVGNKETDKIAKLELSLM